MNPTAKIRKLFIKPKYLVYRQKTISRTWELLLVTENDRTANNIKLLSLGFKVRIVK